MLKPLLARARLKPRNTYAACYRSVAALIPEALWPRLYDEPLECSSSIGARYNLYLPVYLLLNRYCSVRSHHDTVW